jgi:hypothetical protein
LHLAVECFPRPCCSSSFTFPTPVTCLSLCLLTGAVFLQSKTEDAPQQLQNASVQSSPPSPLLQASSHPLSWVFAATVIPKEPRTRSTSRLLSSTKSTNVHPEVTRSRTVRVPMDQSGSDGHHGMTNGGPSRSADIANPHHHQAHLTGASLSCLSRLLHPQPVLPLESAAVSS